MRRLLSIAVTAWAFLMPATAGWPRGPSQDAGDPTGLPNGSFEEAAADGLAKGRPAGWQPVTWGGKAEFLHVSEGREGSRCVSIRSERGADAGWLVTMPLELNATYRLSGWIKTRDVVATTGRRALLNLHNLQPLATPAVTGTSDWTRVELTFESGSNDALQINCLFGGWGQATGQAWYDDLRLELIESRPWNPSVVIDAAKTGHEISPYIYGQFIEHLGRCIYGGIWAEMLEDRKFFYPVGLPGSPWGAVGAAAHVTMDTVKPFVGQHSPRIALDGENRGILQARLVLVRDQRYVGHVWLAGTAEAAPVRVSLVWGMGPDQRETVTVAALGDDFTRSPLAFTARETTDAGWFEIASSGHGELRVGTVSLMPADHVEGMRRDTLALLHELDAPVYRWPGGNFVSGYDWKDGIGERDRRPPRKNPAWSGIEHNDFGVNEFMTFCRLLGTEPYITVNSGLGEVESAVEELTYVNGDVQTAMGGLRAAHGHPEPYAVRFWAIGNEMYGDWQLGHMPLEKYIEKHKRFAEAMRAADPSIELIAVGAVGAWSEGMLTHCADHMDLLSEHFYCGESPGLAGHVAQIPQAVRRIAQAHREYRKSLPSLRGKEIRIALDEWNYWYGPHLYGELGTRYFLKDALGVAAGLHEYARQSDLYFMANYAQTVNVIGCIKTTKTAAAFDTTGLVLLLYRKHFGTVPVAVACEPPLDVAAAWSADRASLTIAIVNPTMRSLDIPLTVNGATFTGNGRSWEISGPDPMAFNAPGEKPGVVTKEYALEDHSMITRKFETLPVAPCSVTLYALEAR
ncbi:MAG: alpha-L-arabinofuranosidase C-terminal domain-containing protein [Planctomycetota bacterium]